MLTIGLIAYDSFKLLVLAKNVIIKYMTINKITIENVKGISSRTFDLDIIPNRPSLLVAPNGFGKSTIAASFISLQANRLSVHEEHIHKGNEDLNSKLIVEFTDSDDVTHIVEANENANGIKGCFDYFVINNQIKAKGVGRNIGGRTAVSASILVKPVTLVDTIPNRVDFEYSFREMSRDFGVNGRVLTNIREFFSDRRFVLELCEQYESLERILQMRNQRVIGGITGAVNAEVGTAVDLRRWLSDNRIGELRLIEPLTKVAELVLASNLGVDSEVVAYLAAIQIANYYSKNKPNFKNACKYSNYKLEKEDYAEMLRAFNTSWCRIYPKEVGRKLIVEFPKAHQISNGQRDVITFVALIYRAQRKLKGQNSILIIDEVFDYLDDANLVAVQYYITKLIDKYKESGRRIYPLILTHLNPYYFKNFAFSKQKTYYLDKKNIAPNESFVKLLRNRDEPTIKDEVSKYLLHYHTDQIVKREEFRELRLKETWGEGNNFNAYVEHEVRKYLEDQDDYEPLAICCAVRKKVEEVAFNQIIDDEQRDEFLNTFKTRDKLSFAEEIGAIIPEYFYLLGIIYNDGMHWREGQDNISPIAAKLENQTIKKLISEIYV